MSVDPAALIVKLGERVVAQPCVELQCFLDVTDDAAIIDFYQRCREALGERLTHYQAENMKNFALLNERGNSLVPTWFTQPKPGKVDYFIAFGGSDLNEHSSAATILMRVMRRAPADTEAELAKMRAAMQAGKRVPFYPTSDLRVTLPLDHPLAQPAALRRWVEGFEVFCAATGFSATVGFALNFLYDGMPSAVRDPTMRAVASYVRRHIGLAMLDESSQAKAFLFRKDRGDILPLVRRVSWLTLLCDRTVDALGGEEALRGKLGDDLPIDMGRLPHGVCIQAGPQPEWGDLAQREFIPAYRRVAQAIRPVRIPEIGGLGKEFMRTEANEWLNAFDVEYD